MNEIWTIFTNTGNVDKAKEVEYFEHLQRWQNVRSHLGGMDPWDWAKENFLKPFPFLNEEAIKFYRRRLEVVSNPLAFARYAYAICAWDLSSRSELLKKAGLQFITVGHNSITLKNGRIEAMAAARETGLGLTFLLSARFTEEASKEINQLIELILSNLTLENIPSMLSFMDMLADYIKWASENNTKAVMNRLQSEGLRADDNWKSHAFESILKWKSDYLAEIHKTTHSYLTELNYERGKKRVPGLAAAHFFKLAAIHAIGAGDTSKAGEMLALVELEQTKEKFVPIIATFSISQEENERIYTKLAEEVRGLPLIIRLAYFTYNDFKIPKGEEPSLRSLFSTSYLQGQTNVQMPHEENEIRENLIRQGVFAAQMFWTGIDVYISKGWIKEDDLFGIFYESGFIKTALFVREAQIISQYGLWNSSLHLLVPTIERFLQEILINLGEASTYINQDNSTQVPVLSSLLIRVRDQGILNEEDKKFILVQLDKEGRNIRNVVCHDLYDYSEDSCFNYRLCFFLLLLILAKWHVWKLSLKDSKIEASEEKKEKEG